MYETFLVLSLIFFCSRPFPVLASLEYFPQMHSLFHSGKPEPTATVEPVPTIFPAIAGADIASVFVGKRVAGDFYDSIRVSPQRVLVGLLDVAGRRQDNRNILAATQEIFRNSGVELFSKADINESDAMTE